MRLSHCQLADKDDHGGPVQSQQLAARQLLTMLTVLAHFAMSILTLRIIPKGQTRPEQRPLEAV